MKHRNTVYYFKTLSFTHRETGTGVTPARNGVPPTALFPSEPFRTHIQGDTAFALVYALLSALPTFVYMVPSPGPLSVSSAIPTSK